MSRITLNLINNRIHTYNGSQTHHNQPVLRTPASKSTPAMPPLYHTVTVKSDGH